MRWGLQQGQRPQPLSVFVTHPSWVQTKIPPNHFNAHSCHQKDKQATLSACGMIPVLLLPSADKGTLRLAIKVSRQEATGGWSAFPVQQQELLGCREGTQATLLPAPLTRAPSPEAQDTPLRLAASPGSSGETQTPSVGASARCAPHKLLLLKLRLANRTEIQPLPEIF